MNLDDLTHFQHLDPENMLGHIDGLAEQCWKAWEESADLKLPESMRQIRAVIISGMGGSAIGGDLAQALAEPESSVPIAVIRGYELPAYVHGPDFLVIASSHSGNTEETLAIFEEAARRGTQRLSVTGGGELAQRSQTEDVIVLPIRYPSQPRAAAGYSFMALVRILVTLSLITNKEEDLQQAVQWMQHRREVLTATSPAVRNPAKRLAGQLVGRIPVVYGAGILAPVARRWKTQFNENAKTWSEFEVMPELNHNASAGIHCPSELMTKVAVIQLLSAFDHPRIRIRHDITREILMQQGILVDVVKASGESRLAQMLTSIQYGDYTSYYLAMANEVDPTPIPSLVTLKERLAEIPS